MLLRKDRLTVLLALGVVMFSLPAAPAAAPDLPLPVRSEKIASLKIGESREFWVSLPDGYEKSDSAYPVLYMMDGEFNFNSGVIGGLRHAAQMGDMPEFIIVGIRNTDRSLDIFPEQVTYRDGSKAGGRADQYLDFIRAELIPYIGKYYRCERFRALYGTSNSGFTAVYALFRDPGLADFYIAASATLRLPFFLAKRDQWIKDFQGGKRQLALVMGERDLPTVLSQNGELKEKIDMLAPANLTCRFIVVANGGHVPADALLQGIRGCFEGWKIPRPLSEDTFDEVRAQVDKRFEKFGVRGLLPEDELKSLGESLLAGKKIEKALEVFRYLADSYPRSADAQVGLGDACRASGDRQRARECFKRALALAPGHAGATAKLKELE